jgi:hypothetical protein
MAAVAVAAIAALLGLTVSDARAAPTAETTEAELRRMTQEMLDAIAPGNAEVWPREQLVLRSRQGGGVGL